jgi:tetratricopeptide (TPR) repeat protein
VRLGDVDLVSLQADEEAVGWYREAWTLFREAGDAKEEASMACFLGDQIQRVFRDDEAARWPYERGRALWRALGDAAGEARAARALGFNAGRRGEAEEARRLHEAALELARGLDDGRGQALDLQALGELAFARGELDAARALHEDARGRFFLDGDDMRCGADEAASVERLADVALARAEPAEAGALYEEAASLYEGSPNDRRNAGVHRCWKGLGEVALACSDAERARALFERALAFSDDEGVQRACVERLAGIVDPESARILREEMLHVYLRTVTYVDDLAREGTAHARIAGVTRDRAARDQQRTLARVSWALGERPDLVPTLDAFLEPAPASSR